MTMKLNQILYQRSKDWLENRPKTGILNMLGRVNLIRVMRKKETHLMITSGDILRQVIKQLISEVSSEFLMYQEVNGL